ncbi:excinuclease ABC subunit UvrC [Hydrogenimonas thermophila]|uniref:excinuclease ABC subunit UvrC n=1 Tax=Hydrogenimonas thermophila TaxID=223786 RepID=UPI002936DA30|nr:excinuclease ABC subunit UvrC [Hydrogenimonas thermophila]WOE70613.1 excinuclease ABC subunit UvrC [Hydrogenimonas thermophila]WOE73131.1 excinuclease ABC subunit UvrC [Hydrogenimonas thermophila]
MLTTLKNLPDKPGVYQYFDKDRKLLYVGKAKSLKKRVKSYFRFTPELAPAQKLSPRIYNMVSQIAHIETIVTNSESDALLLENSLIKQLRPKYNILLRDDKTYPYLYIDLSEPFARLELTRKVVKGNKVKYFGPFPNGSKAILSSIYELVPLVQKKSCIKGKKACLFHQIKRCMAPCEGKISQKEYSKLIDEAIGYIHNKKALLTELEKRMEKYAEQLRFEEAAQIRDRIEAIKKIEEVSTTDIAKLEDLDIFTVAFDETRGVVVRLFMREGKIVSSSHTYIEEIEEQIGEEEIEAIYRRTILEFYTAETPFTARSILTAHSLSDRDELESILSERFGKRIHLHHPKRGEKKRLIDLGLQNATELLRQKRSKPQSDILERIKSLLNLTSKPTRVEVYDNSHLMGTATVGAMVVYDNEKWDKASYRHYNLNAKDEYHQMQEMLTRRIESFSETPPPDLWVIDGGETLRVLAENLLKNAGVNLPVVGVAKEKIDAKAHRAKGSAKDILYTEDGELRLQPTDTRLQWFQRLRDEAHRFAISFHKKQRLKKDKTISLLEVNGIGPAKVKRLLDFFGTFEEIKKADFETLCSVVSSKDAKAIKDFFNNKK